MRDTVAWERLVNSVPLLLLCIWRELPVAGPVGILASFCVLDIRKELLLAGSAAIIKKKGKKL